MLDDHILYSHDFSDCECVDITKRNSTLITSGVNGTTGLVVITSLPLKLLVSMSQSQNLHFSSCSCDATIGSFSNDNGDGNVNVTRKCNNFAIIPIPSTFSLWAKYAGTKCM